MGYWAFGNAVAPFIVLSFTTPSYGSTIANAFLIAQVPTLQLMAHVDHPFEFPHKFILHCVFGKDLALCELASAAMHVMDDQAKVAGIRAEAVLLCRTRQSGTGRQ